MPNYKMIRASEQAIRTIIKAQRECEEMYVSEADAAVFPNKENVPEPEEQ